MGCCETRWVPEAPLPAAGAAPEVPRRAVLTGAVLGLGMMAAGAPARAADAKKIRLAFCSQLLCVIPYEVTRARGLFAAHGLEVELVYSRGGNQAMQALVGGAVDYAATAFDVALQAAANGADIRRFASTGRLPLFALATAPGQAATLTTVPALEGHTVGVSGLGNADHALMLYLLKKVGADPRRVRFAVLGPNISEALRLNQIDAAMVQEPALSRARASGSTVLVNFMDMADAEKYLGGPYEFMGVAVRAGEIAKRKDEMAALAAALGEGLKTMAGLSTSDLIAALPRELIVGADRDELVGAVDHYRRSLYPTTDIIDVAACDRVAESLKSAGLIKPDIKAADILDLQVVQG